MNGTLHADRRSLARELSRIADASVARSIAQLRAAHGPAARRIGVTGPPGAGKSTLIGHLAQLRCAMHAPLAILAIDPTSPENRGSLLGDRIRMDARLADTDVYIRSLPSGRATGGLSDNVADVLAALDAHGFAEVWLETVGVGQAEYSARTLVDTLVLVLNPGSGDQIQAMKAGILETADIVVVNKADQPGAQRVAVELRSVLQRRAGRRGGPSGADLTACRGPAVLLTAANDAASLAALSAELDERLAQPIAAAEVARRQRAREVFHAQALLHRRIDELVAQAADDAMPDGVAGLYEWLAQKLVETA